MFSVKHLGPTFEDKRSINAITITITMFSICLDLIEHQKYKLYNAVFYWISFQNISYIKTRKKRIFPAKSTLTVIMPYVWCLKVVKI